MNGHKPADNRSSPPLQQQRPPQLMPLFFLPPAAQLMPIDSKGIVASQVINVADPKEERQLAGRRSLFQVSASANSPVAEQKTNTHGNTINNLPTIKPRS